jgi:NTE family protein
MQSKTPTVSLVLGSGGARGLAHIGVIEWLNENGYHIRSISGSSMGALIGGIYAAGKLDIYANWVQALERLDVIRLLDVSFGRSGIFKGEKIINTLKGLIGDANIEDLPIKFTAVATDLDAGKEVWFDKGPLFDAIRASIAIPTVFTPVKYHGHTLVDGGLVNPLPIAPTLSDLTDLTIAVSLSGRPEPKKHADKPPPPPSTRRNKYHQTIVDFIDELQQKWVKKEPDDLGFVNVVSQSIDTMQSMIARFKLASYSPDVIIMIPKNASGFFEFERASELIEIGRRRADQAFNQSI